MITFVKASDSALNPNLNEASVSSKEIESNVLFASEKIEFASFGVLFFRYVSTPSLKLLNDSLER